MTIMPTHLSNHGEGLEASAPEKRTSFLPPAQWYVKGNGSDMVLLHGGSGSASHWNRNFDALANHFRVHVIDLPGYGDSPDVPDALSLDGYVEWVRSECLRQTQGRDFHLVGFSFGGALASLVASTLETELRALTLVGPAGFGPVAHGVRPLSLRRVPWDSSREEIEAALKENLLSMMLVGPDAIDHTTLDAHEKNIRRARFDSRQISWRNTTPTMLARLSAPVQLIWGDRDAVAQPSIQARIEACKKVCPGVRVDVIDDAGHWVQYEKSAKFNETLLSFAIAFTSYRRR